MTLFSPAPTAKGKLVSICQKFAEEGEAPKLLITDDKNAAGNYVCICNVPGLKSDLGQFCSQSFSGEAPSKKAAMAAACQKAWACVSTNPLLEVLKPPEDLWFTINQALSNEVITSSYDIAPLQHVSCRSPTPSQCLPHTCTWLLACGKEGFAGVDAVLVQTQRMQVWLRVQPSAGFAWLAFNHREAALHVQALHRDLDLQGQVWLAERHADGRLPAAVLCNARKVYAWFKTYDPPAADSPHQMWVRICEALQRPARQPGAGPPEVHACKGCRTVTRHLQMHTHAQEKAACGLRCVTACACDLW